MMEGVNYSKVTNGISIINGSENKLTVFRKKAIYDHFWTYELNTQVVSS